jgi:hypothetical protein
MTPNTSKTVARWSVGEMERRRELAALAHDLVHDVDPQRPDRAADEHDRCDETAVGDTAEQELLVRDDDRLPASSIKRQQLVQADVGRKPRDHEHREVVRRDEHAHRCERQQQIARVAIELVLSGEIRLRIAHDDDRQGRDEHEHRARDDVDLHHVVHDRIGRHLARVKADQVEDRAQQDGEVREPGGKRRHERRDWQRPCALPRDRKRGDEERCRNQRREKKRQQRQELTAPHVSIRG